MNRAAKFFRSLLPADPFQVFFLAGLVCLTIAPHLRWWPSYLDPVVQSHSHWISTPAGAVGESWRVAVTMSGLALMVASSAGYFLCFFPARRAALKVMTLILVPSLGGVLIVALVDSWVRIPFKSVLSSRITHGYETGWRLADLWSIGTGLHVTIAGLLFTTIFLARMGLRESQLPLILAPPVKEDESAQFAWADCKWLIWFAVASCSGIAWRFPHLVLFSLLRLWSFWNDYLFLFDLLLSAAANGTVFAAALWLMGSENRKLVLAALRVAGGRLLLLGIALPIVVTIAVPAFHYLVDRTHWAAHDFGRFGPPQLAGYFTAPSWWVLTGIGGVFVEEIIFRGVLQRHFVSRYGLWRGLVMVGVVWSAFHFFSDRYSADSELWALADLSHRIAQCLIFGLVLGWLTIRSGSLYPAILTHWLSNAGFYTMEESTKVWWRTAAWLVVAFFLYRFWPLKKDESIEPLTPAVPEAADA